MVELSILIPAKNEMFLDLTIKNLLENIQGDTEIITVLDGFTTKVPQLPESPKSTIIVHSESVGQRAACNEAARLSKAKYLMKVDAHCSFDKGFDVKLMEIMQPDWTLTPLMRNLHAFDWVCEDGHKRYQGPSGPCEEEIGKGKCGKPTKRDVLWFAKPSPNNTAYRFDNTLHFQYWGAYKEKQKGDIVESMSLQGSCFMLTRKKWFELNICDEAHGSWGQQGTEVACKTWLSGGKVKVYKKTWYAHLFRTQGGDFGFPYPNPGISKARKVSRDLWLNDNWDKAIHKLSWLIDKFAPVPDWGTSKGIAYYTDNELDPKLMKACQDQLRESVGRKHGNYKIVSVGLKKTPFGEYYTLPLERGYLTMFKQILQGLKGHDTDIVFLCEHDVLYHPSHFDFIPEDKGTFYYNENVWFLRLEDGHALHYIARQVSGLCAYREPLIKHYEERVRLVEKEGFTRRMGFEPMTHNRIDWENKFKVAGWKSRRPNIDIKHGGNLVGSRWKKSEFRNQKYTLGWTESDESIPGWGNIKSIVKKLKGDNENN